MPHLLVKTRDALDAIMSALDVSGYGEEMKSAWTRLPPASIWKGDTRWTETSLSTQES